MSGNFFVKYPTSSGANIYPNISAAPTASASNLGSLAVALDNGNLYEVTSSPVAAGSSCVISLLSATAPVLVSGSNLASVNQAGLIVGSGSMTFVIDNVAHTLTVTMPSTAGASQADYIYCSLSAVEEPFTVIFWLDIDNNGAGPDPAGDWYIADNPPARTTVRVPISTGNTAAQNATALYTALHAAVTFNLNSSIAPPAGASTSYAWTSIAAP